MVDDVVSSTEIFVCGTVHLWCICSDCGAVLTIEDRDDLVDCEYNIYIDPHVCKEVNE